MRSIRIFDAAFMLMIIAGGLIACKRRIVFNVQINYYSFHMRIKESQYNAESIITTTKCEIQSFQVQNILWRFVCCC